MKKIFQITLVLITSIAFYSCSKNTSTKNTTSDSSQWTFKGVTYTGLATSYDTTDVDVNPVSDVLKSTNEVSDSISIIFWTHPTVSATFTVNSGNLPRPDPTTCTIWLYHAGDMYASTGKAGDSVDLKISGDTLTATFKNVTLIIGDTSFVTQTVSGTLIKK